MKGCCYIFNNHFLLFKCVVVNWSPVISEQEVLPYLILKLQQLNNVKKKKKFVKISNMKTTIIIRNNIFKQ